MLSNLSRSSGESHAQPWPGLKYVASGVEVYRYGGKAYPVLAGQFLYAPELHPGDVEIGRSDSPSAVGFCVYLPETDRVAGRNAVDSPMIFPAACSALGRLLGLTRSGFSAFQQGCIVQKNRLEAACRQARRVPAWAHKNHRRVRAGVPAPNRMG